jgi:ferrous-iron efflux pump FieF
MNAEHRKQKADLMKLAGLASMVTVSILVVLKVYAYWQSGSISVLASLVDSLMDGCVSLMTYFSIRLSMKPADDDHRSGHGKVEGLAALFQAAFISGSGMFLLFEAGRRFFNPQEIEQTGIVMIVMLIGIVLTVALVTVQNYAVERTGSLAVEADKAHYSTDVVAHSGVMLVMILSYFGAPSWIDPAFGVLVVLYMASTAFEIAGKGVDMLMDREVEGEVREDIEQTIFANSNVKGLHDLRVTRSGTRYMVSFDIELPGYLSLTEAHDISREIELAIMDKYPDTEVLIHKDPYGDPHDGRHGEQLQIS